MKRIVLVLAAGLGALLYAAAPAIAEDPAPTVKPAVTAPVVVTGTTDVITTAPATRSGLFSRLRARRTGGTMVSTPLPTTGTIVTPAPSTTIPTPMPKPGVTPAGGVVTTTPMVTTASYTVVSTPTRTGLFGRMRSRNAPMTTVPMTVVEPMPVPMPMSGVVPASGTVTMSPMTSSNTMMTTGTTTTTRMGLIARLRARRV